MTWLLQDSDFLTKCGGTGAEFAGSSALQDVDDGDDPSWLSPFFTVQIS